MPLLHVCVQRLAISDAQERVAVQLGCPLLHWLVQKHDPLLMGLPVWGEGDDLSLCSSQGERDEWEATRT